ncbi:hypothetical protein Vretimale_14442 [Volvox reticuliferus]|uniref:Uncharacterized protein n=1 Tax=Volvox reticuliferus TaxID=1737510 RepID=A0A8J4GND4_9CHLO|nr:hypothetical protein Vretimale_14442 [Volvox reticuliferus]
MSRPFSPRPPKFTLSTTCYAMPPAALNYYTHGIAGGRQRPLQMFNRVLLAPKIVIVCAVRVRLLQWAMLSEVRVGREVLRLSFFFVISCFQKALRLAPCPEALPDHRRRIGSHSQRRGYDGR